MFNKKGQNGLEILLSLVAMLFMIGIIIMVFVIAGSKLADTTQTTETTSASQALVNLTGTTLTDCNSAREGTITSITSAVNATGGEAVGAGNYTYSVCYLYGTDASTYNDTLVNVSYGFQYYGNTQPGDVINKTTASIGGITTWFPTFIVLGAMAVLIILVTIIIFTIRGSGIMGEGGQPPKESA